MKEKLFWYQDLTGGIDQSTNPTLVGNNESPLLQNVNLDRPGIWASRKGTSILGNVTSGSDRVWGLFSYNKSDGTHTFFRICARDLEKFDGTDTWTATDTDEWTASKKVNAVNFKDRLYIGCEDGTTALAWCVAAGTITDVTPTIGGHYLAVAKSILAVGGNNIKPNVIFYSDPYTDQFHRNLGTSNAASATVRANADEDGTNYLSTTTSVFEPDMVGSVVYNTTLGEMLTAIAWTQYNSSGAATASTFPDLIMDGSTAGWDGDTVYVLSNNFVQDGRVTGIVSYQEKFISFDEDNMYLWDPTSSWSQKIPGFGCVNERSIQIVNGYLIWVNRDGIWLYSGSGLPVDISSKIKDGVTGYGLFNLINDANWSSIAAGTLDGKYYLSVGTLSTLSGAPASALANAEFVFDTQTNIWTVNSREDKPAVYATYINTSYAKNLYYGETTSYAVYKMNTGTTDATHAAGTADITFDIRTPYYTFSDPTVQWRIVKYYVKYKAASTVTMTDSIDGAAYATVVTLPAATTTKVQEIIPPTEKQGFTFSLKFSGTTTFQVEGVGFVAQPISYGSVSI